MKVDIWYVGPSNSRIITSAQWQANGFTADTVSWNTENGWAIPHNVFSSGQLAILEADPDFLLGQDGPRLHPAPNPLPNSVESLASAFVYYRAMRGLIDRYNDVEQITAAAERTALAVRMRPSSSSLYPADDVVSYTVTHDDPFGTPVYAGQRHFFFKDADIQKRWRYSGVWHDFSNNAVNQISGADPTDFNNSTSYEVEFLCGEIEFAIPMRSAALTDFRVYVDDMPVSAAWELSASGVFDFSVARFEFATARVRKIRLLASGFMSFTGVLTPAGGSIWAAPPRFRVAITGDSYVQGGHWLGPIGHLMGGGLCNQLAIVTGWEVLNLGQGGTGYVNNSDGTIGKSPYGSPARLAALDALPPLDLIIAFGSGNDSGYPTGTVIAAANAFWTAVHAARPDTPIVVAGVQSGTPVGFDPSLMDTLNTALIAAAEAHPAVAGTIDMRSAQWWTGSGNEGTPNDTGNQDLFMSADEVHPSRAGYENLGLRLRDALGPIRA